MTSFGISTGFLQDFYGFFRYLSKCLNSASGCRNSKSIKTVAGETTKSVL